MYLCGCTCPQGRPSPWGNDAFSTLFQIPPYFRKNFLTRGNFLPKFYLFPDKFSDFFLPKFLMTFLVIEYKFEISPLFSMFHYIYPLFRKNHYSSLYLQTSLHDFVKLTCFLYTFCVFRFPPTLTMMHYLCIT